MFRLICFCLLLSSCIRQIERGSNDYYNLGFSRDPLSDFAWSLEMKYDTLSYSAGWAQDRELEKCFFILEEKRGKEGRHIPLEAVLSQQIPLLGTYSQAVVDVRIKGVNLQEGWFKVYSMGINENCLGRDSVKIEAGSWKNYSLHIPLENVQYLYIVFDVKGKEHKSPIKAGVGIDSVRIFLDNHLIEIENRIEKRNIPELDDQKLIPLSFAEDSVIGHIDCLTDPQTHIIGLGETMHGNKVFGSAIAQIIRWLVENQECKLVMVEMPGMLVLKWDLFIQGYPVNLAEIIDELAGSLTDRESIAKLLIFLKEYNGKVKKKVHLTGIDRSATLDCVPLMHDYFYHKYQSEKNPQVYKILDTQFNPDTLLPLLMKPELVYHLGDFEYNWFKHLYWLTLMEKYIPGVQEHGVRNYRDYIMWRYAYYALESIKLDTNECAVVTGHWLHLNKWKMVNSVNYSLGYYLAEYYGKGYISIALLGGQGTFENYSYKNKQFFSDTLQAPEKGSLEKSAMESGLSYFFYPTQELVKVPIHIRYVPVGTQNKGFVALNIPKRMDGFIFVKDCESIVLPERQKNYNDCFRIALQRKEWMKERNKGLNIR